MGQRCRSFGHCPNDVPKVYVLVSRVTDPRNFLLCGLPPKDLWEYADVSRKVKEEGEKAKGDEDGPPSELEQEQRAEVSASESESEARVGGSSSSHEPYVAWNR